MKKSRHTGLLWILTGILLLQLLFPARVQATQSTLQPVELPVPVEYGCYSLDAKVPVMGTQQLISNMDAAVLFDVHSNILLYGLNADLPMYPASLTKMVTTLVAVELANIKDAVTVKDSVLATVPQNAVKIYLLPNEVLPLEELIYCTMVGSANDAAAVVADYVCGSQEAFVAEMNRFVKEIGCTGTNFTNAHGLHDPAQITTARDIAKILCYALDNPVFMEFFSTIYHNVPETNLSESRYLSSNNYLMNTVDNMRLYNDNRVTGGRTGTTDDDKRCIAATAEVDDRLLISVVMGATSKYTEEMKTITYGGFAETTELLNYGFEQYKVVQVLHENQIFRQSPVVNGDCDVVLGSAESAYAVLPVTVSPNDLSYRYFDTDKGFVAPVEKGKRLSHVEIWYGNVCLTETDLYAMGAVRTAAASQVPGGNQQSSFPWQKIVIGLLWIVGGILLILLVLRLVARLRLAAVKNRRRRYRKSRRRSR